MRTQPLTDSGTIPSRLEPLRPIRTRGPALNSRGEPTDNGATRTDSANVTVTVERSPTGCLLRVAGELDGNTRCLLEAILEHIGDDTCGGRIELDLSDVSFADCQGLLPALRSNTMITTASPAVRSTLRTLRSE